MDRHQLNRNRDLGRFARSERIAGLLVGLLLMAGCGGSGSSAPAGSGTVSGKLIISPDNTVEMEPNDTLTQAQAVNGTLTISGNIAKEDPGIPLTVPDLGPVVVSDLYNLTTSGPVQITLSIAANDPEADDLDLVLLDNTGALVEVSAGAVSTELIETSAAGSFLVGIYAYQGSSAYVLNFSPLLSSTVKIGRVPLGASFVPGEVLVKLKPSESGNRQKSDIVGARHGLVRKESFPQEVALMQVTASSTLQKGNGGKPTVTAFNGEANALKALTLDTLEKLEKDPDVAYAEPNFIRKAYASPSDPRFPLQWHYSLINLPQAWDVTTGSPDVIVAVIDTGIAPHPELDGQRVPGFDFISDPASAGDNDGLDADPTDEGDDPNHKSSSFHGTHVAGTVSAATDNATGVAGVGWQTKVMPLRVLGAGGGTDADIAQAIRYAARLQNSSGTLPAQRAHIINMSLGGPGFSQTLQDAVTAARNANVIIVAAAGNENVSTPSSPASLDGVISVSAVDIHSKKAPYSNYGRTIDVTAPGGNTSTDFNGDGFSDGILSTMINEEGEPFFRFHQGTSMASPHVAGVIALMLSVNRDLTPPVIDQLLAGTHPNTTRRITRDIGASGRDDLYGHGLIDAAQAVLAAREVPGTPSGTAPSGPILSVSTSLLDFRNFVNTLSIDVSNAGIGTLQITAITEDAPWLTVTPASGTAPLAVNATIDRTGLAAGTYQTAITITSDADATGGNNTATIMVQMSVGEATLGDVGTVFVLVIDKDTHETLAQAETSFAQGYTYSIPEVPEGSYIVVAGTDRDNDDFIRDIEDASGFFSDLVTVTPGTDRSGTDFLVGEFASPQSTKAEIKNMRGKKFKRLF